MKLDRFRKSAEAPMLPITALVDVLFLMIIFLVLGANFEQLQAVRLPEARGGPAPERHVMVVHLHDDGRLRLEGNPIEPEELLKRIDRANPARVLLLPDQQARVGPLFRWYDRIQTELGISVQVGVMPPSP